ncbi:hypothetical protein A9K55_005182 [Cordyceps militaris]|uniref:Uncharacterized protein n=1 Tax=Cordyceps militaris TaxID=73501 RepID=A0A2H4SNK2_CORMI|nr:hypothetical protein A9K55_005182 [Cordyceps militaris]
MKAVFVSLATLALSVFAAPSPIEGSLAVREPAAVASSEFSVEKRAQSAEDLINAINKATGNVNTIGVSINVTIGKFKAGAITKLTATRLSSDDLQKLIGEIGALAAKLLSAARVALPKEALQLVQSAIGGFIRASILVFGALVDAFGISGIPFAILNISFSLFTTFLTASVAVFGKDIAPGLLLILQDILGGLSGQASTVLGPSLKFLAGFLRQYGGI